MKAASSTRRRVGALLCCCWLPISCQREAETSAGSASEPVTLAGRAFGSTWSVKLAEPLDAARAANLGEAVQTALDRVDAQLSNWRDDSEVSRFNARRDTNWFAVSAETARVAAEALRLSELSGGAFDPTVEPLVRLWGFGPARRNGPLKTIPTDESIAAARTHVDWRKLHVRSEPPALRKDDVALTVDYSALADGHALEMISSLLEQRGRTNFLAEIGGALSARGRGPWRVAIEQPWLETRAVLRTMTLENTTLSSSGTYRNSFEIAGKRYSHLINARTGWPVVHALATVSVVHDSALMADGLDTMLAVLGPEAGWELAERNGWAALFVSRDGALFWEKPTTEFERRFPRE